MRRLESRHSLLIINIIRTPLSGAGISCRNWQKRASRKACPALALIRFALPESPEKKVRERGLNLPPKQTWQLVRLSFAMANLMKAKFWGKYLQKSVRSFVDNIPGIGFRELIRRYLVSTSILSPPGGDIVLCMTQLNLSARA